MKINGISDKIQWIYKVGFYIILALPILTWPPYFFPADWGKSIIFRSVLAILLFLFAFQLLYKNNPIRRPWASNGASKIIWALAGLFVIFLLASIFSVDPYFSFWGSPYRGSGFINFVFCFIFAILTFILSKKPDWKKAWIFSIFIGILVCFVAFIQYYGLFSNIFASTAGRPASTMGNPIILAIYLLLLFFPTLAFTIKEKNIGLRMFFAVSLAIFLFTILITGSRAAYFGILAGIIFFLLAYPKKMKALKICLGLFLILVFSVVLFVNVHPQVPKALQNRVIQNIVSRLSIKQAFGDERFLEWKTAIKAVVERPILGWGPENFSVGFDKNYDPMTNPSPWWDRAHNIFLDIGSQTGILGILAYISLFIVLFWNLQKAKKNSENGLVACGLQATLIGYLVANFFSFDSFGTYLIFFLIISYSLHLTSPDPVIIRSESTKQFKYKNIILAIAFLALIIFLWQYNFLPLKINAEINKAAAFADQKDCHQAFVLMENIMPEQSIISSYARLEYGEFVKTCSDYYPENSLAYIEQGVKFVNEATKIQPLYTRYWLFMGESTTIAATKEINPETKIALINQANNFFDKALQLAPRHQEILIGKAKLAIVAGDYKKMQNYLEVCILLNPNLGDCYWYLGLSKIYLKDIDGAKKDIQLAEDKGYDYYSSTYLGELADAYGSISDYQDLALVYEKLIKIYPNVAQYHSSLAFFYKQLGRYKEARQEALKVLDISPESKPNVDAFLKTLP